MQNRRFERASAGEHRDARQICLAGGKAGKDAGQSCLNSSICDLEIYLERTVSEQSFVHIELLNISWEAGVRHGSLRERLELCTRGLNGLGWPRTCHRPQQALLSAAPAWSPLG